MGSNRGMQPAQPNQSLIDGLACLQALASQPGPIGSRELGRQLGLEPTRVNRLLKTLAYLGMAQQDEKRKYSPGPMIHVLAAQSLHGSGMLTSALGPLESLLPLGHQVALGVLWRTEVAYLYHASADGDPQAGIGRVPSFPAQLSGLGHALLAGLSDDDVRALYAEPAPDPAAVIMLDGADGLLAELTRVRDQGYALTRTEPGAPDGYRTLALTLPSHPNTAIGLAGRLADRSVPKLVRALREAADLIAANHLRRQPTT